jgi:hypothetical protein
VEGRLNMMNSFAPYRGKYCSFIVRNITPIRNKTIKIFGYPIPYNTTKNLLRIPGICENAIASSLLKGELRFRILSKDIIVEFSDIDLIQFNNESRSFLQNAGISNGLTAGGSGSEFSKPYLFRQEIPLIGIKDNSNQLFYTPDKFITGMFSPTGDKFHISVAYNGKLTYEGVDYQLIESDGPGTGYDGIEFLIIIPTPGSLLFANYVIPVT